MKNEELRLSKDLQDIAFVLNSQPLELPPSLKSDHLMKLIQAEPEAKKPTVVGWLFSKKALPLYTTAIAAALLIAIIPRLNLQANMMKSSDNEAMAMLAGEVNSENGEQVEAEIVGEKVQGDEMLSAPDAGGEDLSKYFGSEEQAKETIISGEGIYSAGIIEENRVPISPESDAPATENEDSSDSEAVKQEAPITRATLPAEPKTNLHPIAEKLLGDGAGSTGVALVISSSNGKYKELGRGEAEAFLEKCDLSSFTEAKMKEQTVLPDGKLNDVKGSYISIGMPSTGTLYIFEDYTQAVLYGASGTTYYDIGADSYKTIAEIL